MAQLSFAGREKRTRNPHTSNRSRAARRISILARCSSSLTFAGNFVVRTLLNASALPHLHRLAPRPRIRACARAQLLARARAHCRHGDSFVCSCRRWCDAAGDNADASKFNHWSVHAVTSRDHARRVACPAHSELPCRTPVPRSQPACPPRWRRARWQVAELLANVTLSGLHARRHRAHPHAVARPQGVHESGVRPLAARHVCAGSPRSLVCM